jgi:DivIVA domain-containing protein
MRSRDESVRADHEMIIRRIESAQFSTTGWRGNGYDEGEVDAWLDDLVKSLRAGRLPDPEKLRNTVFTVTRLRPGYVMAEVDTLLDELEMYATRLCAPAISPIRRREAWKYGAHCFVP